MEFKEISTNDYPLFHDLLNDYYCEGEDEGTEQEVIDSFIKLLFDKVTGREIDGCIVRQRSACDMLTLWGYKSFDEASPTARYFYDNIESGNAIFWSLCNEGNIVGELYSFLKLEDKDFADGIDTAYLWKYRNSWNWRYHLSNKIDEVTLLLLMLLPSGSIDFTGFSIKGNKSNKKIEK